MVGRGVVARWRQRAAAGADTAIDAARAFPPDSSIRSAPHAGGGSAGDAGFMGPRTAETQRRQPPGITRSSPTMRTLTGGLDNDAD